jgi:hypothetical protein
MLIMTSERGVFRGQESVESCNCLPAMVIQTRLPEKYAQWCPVNEVEIWRALGRHAFSIFS